MTPLILHVFLVETRRYGSSPQLDQDEASTGFTPSLLHILHAL